MIIQNEPLWRGTIARNELAPTQQDPGSNQGWSIEYAPLMIGNNRTTMLIVASFPVDGNGFSVLTALKICLLVYCTKLSILQIVYLP